jgi:PTH1 family peptidyl-tRNA hydrolase
VGFRVVDLISEKLGIRLGERRAKAVLGRGTFLGHEVVLAKPRTFMNNSGEGVEYLLTRFAARPSNLLVIYDEMALPLGKLRLRPEGSAAGHNGIRSIIQAVGTNAFPRLRVGIGGPQGEGAKTHVLGGFSEDEKEIINDAVERAADAAKCLLEENIDVAMGRYN